MPPRTPNVPDLARFATALLAVSVLVGSSVPAEARQTRNLAGMDLRVQPGDLAARAKSRPPGIPSAGEPAASPFDSPEAMAEADRVPRTEIPNRRHGGNGILIGDSGMLQDLLENNTIPLFRVTVEPPF